MTAPPISRKDRQAASPAPAIPLPTTPYFSLNAWTDENKTLLLTPTAITSVQSVDGHLMLNQAYEYTIELLLEDANTSGLFKSNYVELKIGRTTPTLLVAGIVTEVVRSDTDQAAFTLTVHSAVLHLNHFNNLGRFVTPYPIYKNILDILNGPTSKRPAPAGKKGVLDPTGWHAQYVAGKGSSTKPPDLFDTGRADWGSAYQNLTSVVELYGMFWREAPGSTPLKGNIHVGPLGDDSGITIYGGTGLQNATDIATHGSLPGVAGNASRAQGMNLIAISSVSRDESTTNVKNLIWPVGSGSGEHMVTLRSIFGDIYQPDGKTLAAGITKWQPNAAHGGAVYYVRTNNKQSYRGNTYEMVAEQANDGLWAYGLVNRTSAAKYGVIEYQHRWPKINNPDVLLSYALGALDAASDPVPSWSFAVRAPFGTTDLPPVVLPGQTIAVQYSGQVHQAMVYDFATHQWVGAGAYTYMTFPGTTDANQLFYLNRVIEVQWHIDDTGYTATYTMGKGKKKPLNNRVLEDIAAKFEQNRHPAPHHAFTKRSFDHITFIFSKVPEAWEDPTTDTAYLSPGAYMIADVPNDAFFNNHQRVSWRCRLSDKLSYLDFIFAKKTDGTLPQLASSGIYGVFRLAMPNSGQKCGFYTTQGGTVFTPRGHLVHKDLMEKETLPAETTYEIEIVMSGGTYEAHVSWVDPTSKDGVMGHNLIAVWNDKQVQGARQIDFDKGFGSIGWHLVGGNVSTSISHVHAVKHRKKARPSHGGHGRRSATIYPAGQDSGHEHRTADEDLNVSSVQHLQHAAGHSQHTGRHTHGPFSPNQGFVSSVTVSGGVYTVLFNQAVINGNAQNPITPGGLKHGWTVQLADGSGRTVVVNTLLYGNRVDHPTQQNSKGKYIVGFTTSSSDGVAIVPGLKLLWDPITEQVGTYGHQSSGMYATWKTKDKKTGKELHKRGWAKALIASDAHGDLGKAVLVTPDGSIIHAEAGQITQPNGAILNVADLVLSARHFAKGLERTGRILFDSGEFDSTTQRGYVYPSNYPTGARGTVITPDSAGFAGGDPASFQMSWVGATSDFATGNADLILAMTSTATFPTVLWQDTVMVDESGKAKGFTVTIDTSFEFPVFVGVAQSSNTLILGAEAHLDLDLTPGSSVTAFIDVDPVLTGSGINDTWVLNPGGTNQETVTITGLSSDQLSFTFSSVANTHLANELLVQKTAYNGGTPVTVQSGGLLDGTVNMGDVTPAINAVAIGFWDGTQWYRGYWGDPTWAAAYLKDSSLAGYATSNNMNFLGKLVAQPGKWANLHCKASELGLWGPTLPRVSIIGVEIAIYGANPGSGQTVYFDAHGQGFTNSGPASPAANVTADKVKPGAIKAKHKHPKHHADAHVNSDVTMWVSKDGDGKYRVHWEHEASGPGSIILHDGTGKAQFLIYAGPRRDGTAGHTSETHPNNGIFAVPVDNTGTVLSPWSSTVGNDIAGNYLVFNTKNVGVWLKDPQATGGKVYIPGYAVGSSGVQTVGFGVVSELFNWSGRKGGGTIFAGPHDELIKIGKLEYNADAHTGEIPIHTHGKHGKTHGKHNRAGSHGKKHDHKHKPHKHHHHNLVFQVRGAI